MGIGAGEREFHTPLDIFGCPTGRTVLADGVQGAGETAVGVGLAGPDVALVDMGVAIDEGRECDAATAVDCFSSNGRATGGMDGSDLSVSDSNGCRRKSFDVEGKALETCQMRPVQPDIAQSIGARDWYGQTARCHSLLLFQRTLVPAVQHEVRDP